MQDDAVTGALAVTTLILLFAWLAVILVAGWRMYAKAGQPGWVALIPFLNVFGLLKIVHRPLWWFLLLLIPFVNIVFLVIIFNDLSKAFGHGVGMTVLLVLLTAVGYLVIGFGDSRYQLEPDPIFG